MAEFDPRYPPTSNSLNRLRLEAAGLPDHIRGKAGYELVSTRALNMLIQPYTADITVFYEQVALEAGWAIEIANTLGTRLGCLLLTLMRNDAPTHQANPDKPAAYWSHWSGIYTIYLGGGLVRGKAGEIITAQAQATLQRLANEAGYQVNRVEYPQYLPLLGAARLVQAGNRASILDFGGSYIKRAIAHYTAKTFDHLQIQDSLLNDFSTFGEDASLIFERMVDIISQSCRAVDVATVPISIAGYVDEDGQPLARAGIYKQLARLTSDIPAALSQAVSDRLGKAVQVRLFHDGTAAALFFAPMAHTAVVMLGTALGSGYPVARPGLTLCPVSPTLSVDGN